jgi:hypothetical protein
MTSPEPGAAPERGIGVMPMELITALALAGIGGAAIWDSLRIGAGWGDDGPQGGYFPMLLGVGLVLASLGNMVLALRPAARGRVFVSWEQSRHVASVLVPTVIYVGLIGVLGIYLASVLLILYFMRVLGKFGWAAAFGISLATMLVFFCTFELWFLVPLPKGPIEQALGF